MELRLKKRITGSLILVAAALIIIPLFFSHSVPSSELQLSDEIPDRPAKPGNFALAIPSKKATVPSPSARADNNSSDNAGAPKSRIVFEQLQSVGSDTNNNTSPNPVVTTTPAVASQPISSFAAERQPATLPASADNSPNASQKVAPAMAMAPVTANEAVATPVLVDPPAPAKPHRPMNIAKLEQQTTATASSTPAEAVDYDASTPLTAADATSITPPVTHKKSTKTNNIQPVKAPSSAQSKNTAPNPESWAVQLGSFSDKLNAENLMKKLQTEGLPAFIRTSKTTHGSLIRVLVGPELHREDAKNLLAKLQKELNLQGMVVKGM